jgi:hypothetical protein
MSGFQWKKSLIGAPIINAVIVINWVFAQSSAPTDQTGRVSIAYVPPENSTLQDLYNFLREHRALERIQEILSSGLRGRSGLCLRRLQNCGGTAAAAELQPRWQHRARSPSFRANQSTKKNHIPTAVMAIPTTSATVMYSMICIATI